MLKRFVTLCVVLVLFSGLADASTNPLNFAGNGARAAAMGNAFTAVADDATAMSWNAAGLTQLYAMEASLVGRFAFGSAEFTNMDPAPEVEYKSKFQLNFASFAVPFSAGKFNVVAGVAYRNVIDFASEVTASLQGIEATNSTEGGVYAITPALGIQFNEMISVGAAMNIYTGSSKDSEKLTGAGSSDYDREGPESKYSGLGVDIGILVKPNPIFSLGANLTLPHTLTVAEEGYEDTEIKVPFFFMIGGAIRPSDQWLISIDYHSRPWSNSDSYKDNVDAGFLKSEWLDLNSFHAGIEYLITAGNSVVPIRIGFYTNPLFLTVDKDENQVVNKVLTLGTGIVSSSFILDGAVEIEPSTQLFDNDTEMELKLFRITIGATFFFGQ